MEVHSMLNYRHTTSSYPKSGTYYGKYSSLADESDPVVLHPLIIGKDIVVCMPEVNRVLRNVYQVLSQANYYLSKHGINSRRYTGAQLIRIKMLGILGHEAKVCSYILQRDAELIFDSFDVTGDCRKSSRIQWVEPVLLDEKPIADIPKKTRSPISPPNHNDGPVDVHLFELGEKIIICAPEIQKVVQANFHQGATVGYYFTKLGIVPYKFIHTSHLDKIKELSIIKRSAVHCTYISKADALRVFDAYGLGGKTLDEKVKFLDVIKLPEHPSPTWKSVSRSIKCESSPSMVDDKKDSRLSPNAPSEQSTRTTASDDDEERRLVTLEDMLVHVFIVEKEEVVCMPDIHKIVQSIHGNSIQVNYYFNKLKVQKKRFCFAHLRELKSRNVLQNNATYCTYVPRADAEKLFQIYCLVDDPKLSHIHWSEPINLDCKPSIDYSKTDGKGNPEGEVVSIHTFTLDNTIVITVPDVHKIVDFLEEQSASLDYHFRKLGINKCRFTYSQLHQLRRLNVIKRPTVCTYITRGEVDRLLNMYETERNKHKLLSINFLPPIALVPGTNPGKPKTPKSPKTEPVETERPFREPAETERNFRQSSPPCEVAPSFVSSSRESCDIVSPTTSAAISHLQNIHPSIDCPIVIPNGDYDPTKFSDDRNDVRNGKRKHSSEAYLSTKEARYDSEYTQLISDINRKEDELRLLHEAYKKEVVEEKVKRRSLEAEFEKLNSHNKIEIDKLRSKLITQEKEMEQVQGDLSTERRAREQLELELKMLKESTD